MELYYEPDINIHFAELSQEEAHHCLKVMRHKVGDHLLVTNGNGKLWKVALLNDQMKDCRFQILEEIASPFLIHSEICIAIAPTKNSGRFEWFLEKATELGIGSIRPMLCKRSVRTKINSERLQKILITASKQCLRTQFPKVYPLQKFHEVLDHCAAFYSMDERFIASCKDKPPLLQDIYNKSEKAVVLIGPEGDFTNEELKQAINAGFKAVSLGEARLRTETAGIAACHTLNLMHQKV